MRKLLRTIKKVKLELNILLLFFLVVYVITEFWLRKLPPFMGWADAHRLADLTANLCLAYIASWIFFFVGDHWQRQTRLVEMKKTVRVQTRFSLTDIEDFIAANSNPKFQPDYTQMIVLKEPERVKGLINAALTNIYQREGPEKEIEAIRHLLKTARVRLMMIENNPDVLSMEAKILLRDVNDHIERNLHEPKGDHDELIMAYYNLLKRLYEGLDHYLKVRWEAYDLA